MTRLNGQVALVTGAGGESGIGFAVARSLVADGATVVLVGLSDRVHDRSAEIGAIGRSADLTSSAAVDRLVADLVASHGRVDIVVNNAGMTTVGESLVDLDVADYDDDTWRSAIDRNLTSAFLVTRRVVPVMRAQGYGRMVNVASTSGPLQAFVGDVGYHAAKAGMVGLTRSVALEVAGDGVTVNAVAAGWIATGSQTDAEAAAGAASPMGRSGTPGEVAAVVRFLVDPSASYVTGHVLVVDGGNSVPEDRSR